MAKEKEGRVISDPGLFVYGDVFNLAPQRNEAGIPVKDEEGNILLTKSYEVTVAFDKDSETIALLKEKALELFDEHIKPLETEKMWGAKLEEIEAFDHTFFPIKHPNLNAKSMSPELKETLKDKLMVKFKAYFKTPPKVVDADTKAIEDGSEAYRGCTIRVGCEPFVYGVKKKPGEKASPIRGVSFGLQTVQVLEKGPYLSNRKPADPTSDFDD